MDASALSGLDGACPGAELRRIGRRPHPALLLEADVGVATGAECSDFVDDVGRGSSEPARVVGAAQLQQAAELAPPAHDEAAVAAAGARPADVPLQQDHLD